MTTVGVLVRGRLLPLAATLRIALVAAGLLAAAVPAHAQETQRAGSIHGLVLAGATRQALAGTAAVVLDRELTALTGDDGRFTVAGVPAGLHRVQIVLVGYDAAILHDVVVRPNRVTPLAVELDEAPSLHEVVAVTADYFSAVEEESVGTVSFNFEEIRRSPGSAGDVSRLLQVLPSVGMATDQRNDLIVRGGSPAENLTVVDNIEIPNSNHFPTQGASGGVIGLLNTALIADCQLFGGRFRGRAWRPALVGDGRDAARREPHGARRRDPERFWRIHRGGIVNVAAIAAARRDLRGRYRLTLKERPEVLRVSAAYGHLFRRM